MRTQFFGLGKTAGGLLAMVGLALSLSSVAQADTTTISGTPATSVKATYYYGFQSWATDNAGRAVVYSIKNKPAWLAFDTQYGHLYGTAPVSAIGTYSNIVISASDGVSTAALPAFSIQVLTSTGASGGTTPPPVTTPTPPPAPPTGGTAAGAATLSWHPPTQTTTGATLSSLAGYKISYGLTTATKATVIQVANAGLTSYEIENLAAGTYAFAIQAYTTSGALSAMSSAVSKTIK